MALDIFQGLKNTSNEPDSSDTIADIDASINVLNMMTRASEYFALQEDVLSVSALHENVLFILSFFTSNFVVISVDGVFQCYDYLG